MGSTQSTWGQSPIDAIIMRLTIVFVLTVMGVMVLLAEAKPTDPLPTNPFNGDESLAEPPIEEEPSGEPPNEDKSPDTSSSQRFRRQVGLRLDGTPELNATINATAEDIIEEVANRLQQQASPNDFSDWKSIRERFNVVQNLELAMFETPDVDQARLVAAD